VSHNSRPVTTVVVVFSLFLNGCVGFATRHYEKVPRKARSEAPATTPVIVVTLMASTAVEEGKLIKAYENIRKKPTFLARARQGPRELDSEGVEYELNIYAHVSDYEWETAELSGYTFGLVPYYWSRKIEFRVTLRDRNGVTLSEHTGRLNVRVATQLLLIWVAPLNVLLIPYLQGRRKVVRALLRLVEQDFREMSSSPPNLP
jgi:hypothetical protein